MEIPRLPASAGGDQVARALGEAGCAIVERLVDPGVLDQVRTELKPYLEATPFGPDAFTGRRTRRTGGLIARSPSDTDAKRTRIERESISDGVDPALRG